MRAGMKQVECSGLLLCLMLADNRIQCNLDPFHFFYDVHCGAATAPLVTSILL
jgi:hypothetical protein